MTVGTQSQIGLAGEVERAVEKLDRNALRQEYWDQNEALFIPAFLPPGLVEEALVPAVQRLRPKVNRNYIPGHKKGGSVSYYLLKEHAPQFLELYRSPSLIAWLSSLAGAELMVCPEDDPHSCALYYYTEPGDHIGFHYDTSYYRGARYTVLLGLIDRAPSCRLVCHLYRDDPNRETREVVLATAPGSLVVFNGDRLWHGVTPLAPGEERVVLTMEYVTNPEMGRFHRMFSNLKDAFAYFGISTLWKRNGR